tara:strand:+ start:172 stop:351 length:180 start_codon:yes stop_codon:yes gene_type:complete
MQLKYGRRSSFGSTLFKIIIKLVLVIIFFIVAIFLVEKVNFPSPSKQFNIDITNEIKKL